MPDEPEMTPGDSLSLYWRQANRAERARFLVEMQRNIDADIAAMRDEYTEHMTRNAARRRALTTWDDVSTPSNHRSGLA